MFLADRLTLDAPTRTKGGFMAVRARAARTGVYQYLGSEVDPQNQHGLRDKASVNVLRDENTVFDQASAQSFIGKPITDNHPSEPITATNWRDHARGTVMGAMRDGEYLTFDLLVTDAEAIAKIDAGKRELSNGYDAGLEFGDFKAADGTVCQARQTSIRGNHVALVDHGRAGSACRITDAATCESISATLFDSLTTEPSMPKIMLIDGLSVDISNADTAEATIKTLITARDAEKAKTAGLETQVATLTTDKATLEAKVVTLEQAAKDAKPTPAQLLAAGKAYQATCDKAKALGVTVTDAMDEAAIMKAVVDAKLGDKAAGWNETQIAASFATMTADATNKVVPIGMPQTFGDGRAAVEAARNARLADKAGAYRAQPAA